MMGIMGHDARKRQRVRGISESLGKSSCRRPLGCRRLPQAPGVSGVLAYQGVGIVELSIIGRDDVALLFSNGERLAEPLPLFGELDRYPTTEDPVKLLVASRRDPKYDQLRDSLRVRFGISERQGAAPGAAEHQPALDS